MRVNEPEHEYTTWFSIEIFHLTTNFFVQVEYGLFVNRFYYLSTVYNLPTTKFDSHLEWLIRHRNPEILHHQLRSLNENCNYMTPLEATSYLCTSSVIFPIGMYMYVIFYFKFYKFLFKSQRIRNYANYSNEILLRKNR